MGAEGDFEIDLGADLGASGVKFYAKLASRRGGMQVPLCRLMFSRGKIAIGPEKCGSRLDDMHGRFERSLFSHGKIAIGIEKDGSRLDDMHGRFEQSSFSHGKIAIGTGQCDSGLDDMRGRFRRCAYRRSENRLFLFRLQSYHGKTTIVQSGRAYRLGESRIFLVQLQCSHEKTSIGKVKLSKDFGTIFHLFVDGFLGFLEGQFFLPKTVVFV